MHDLLLIAHFVGLALALGTGFANFTLGVATSDMDPDSRTKFFLRAFTLSKNGSIGLALLIVTGVALMLLNGVPATFAMGGGAFHAKLGLVLVLTGLLGRMQVLIKRAKLAQGGPAMAQIPQLGRLMLLVGLGVVISAVLAFH
jgi:uncharacterized membrane protein